MSPFCSMLLSAFLYSLVPCLISLSGGGSAPFWFNGFYRLGGALGGLAFLSASGFPVLPLVREVFRWRFALLVLPPYLGFTFFALSAGLAGFGAAVALLETWPVFFVLVMSRLSGVGVAWSSLGSFGWFLLGLSALGAALASWSGSSGGVSLLGALFGLLGALSVASTVGNYRWVVLSGFPALPGLMAAFFLGSLVSAFLNFSLAVLSGGPLSSGLPVGGLLGGALLDMLGTWLNRRANLGSGGSLVNLVNFLSPALGLVWLFLLGLSEVERPLWFLLGFSLLIPGFLFVAFRSASGSAGSGSLGLT